METWETVRHRCRRDGEAIKVVARDLNLAPNTVRKYLRGDDPPARRPRPRACILDRYQPRIDDLIRSTPKITAVRVGSYLREIVDPDLRIDERTLRMYVAVFSAGSIDERLLRALIRTPGDTRGQLFVREVTGAGDFRVIWSLKLDARATIPEGEQVDLTDVSVADAVDTILTAT